MQGTNSDLIDFVVEHVDQESEASRAYGGAFGRKYAHGSDASEAHRHRVVFKQQQQNPLNMLVALFLKVGRQWNQHRLRLAFPDV